jgi:Cdc6-like AAA superfamily ATPase
MTTNYPGVNVLLMGPSGTGKTYSIKTIADMGLETFALFAEPGLETLIGAYVDNGLAIPSNLHWHYIQPTQHGFDQLKASADQIGKFDLAGLAKMKDINRSKSNKMIDLYTCLNNFIDQKDGKEYGPVDSWGTERVLIIDSLSALNRIAMAMVVGTKPVRDMADWGIAQNALMALLHKLTSGCNCHFVLIAHVDREVDQILGGIKLMVSSLGKAITSQIPQPFSDVILSSREGDKFFWDTANSQADVKTRNLPIQGKLPATFEPIFKKWQERKAAATSPENT